MTSIKLTSNKEISNFGVPYVIAEIGSNHNGDMELAKKLIVAAKESGVDCIKFQSWSKDTIFAKKVYDENYFIADDYRNRDDYTLEQIVEEFSISEEELLQMKNFANSLGLDCASTPFSKREVDFLVQKLDAPFIKVASMDLNNYPFLEYIAKQGKPVVLSVGLSELHEIDRAIRTIENTGNTSIVILHCVSIYPPLDEQVNLNNIDTLRQLYPNYPIGFSDHTLGYSIPLAAVVKGVCLIEKHFTLDKSLFGWDHKVSATPDEMAIICTESKRIVKALGSRRISVQEKEDRISSFRRSIIIKTNKKKGEIISESDIDFKRPGTGIAPGEMKYVINRTLTEDIAADSVLEWSHLV